MRTPYSVLAINTCVLLILCSSLPLALSDWCKLPHPTHAALNIFELRLPPVGISLFFSPSFIKPLPSYSLRFESYAMAFWRGNWRID